MYISVKLGVCVYICFTRSWYKCVCVCACMDVLLKVPSLEDSVEGCMSISLNNAYVCIDSWGLSTHTPLTTCPHAPLILVHITPQCAETPSVGTNMWVHEYLPPQNDMCILVSTHGQRHDTCAHRHEGHFYGYMYMHASMSVSKMCLCLNTNAVSVVRKRVSIWKSEHICGTVVYTHM